MKITIQHYDEIASLEVSDQCELETFQEHFERILRVMWLPEQVDEIMRVKDWDDGFDAGKEEGYDKAVDENNNSTQVIFDEGYVKGHDEGYKEGLAFRGKAKEDSDETQKVGYKVGINGGYTKSNEEHRQDGYDDGHNDGYTKGHDDGYKTGKAEGFREAEAYYTQPNIMSNAEDMKKSQ